MKPIVGGGLEGLDSGEYENTDKIWKPDQRTGASAYVNPTHHTCSNLKAPEYADMEGTMH